MATKTAAREYCNGLLKEDKLVPLNMPGSRCPTLEEFARDFWDYEKSEYIRSRKGRSKITRTYAYNAANVTKNQILPVFGKRRLDTITQAEVDKWLTSYAERGLKAASMNSAFQRLQTMMNWAVFKKLIKFSPCNGIQKLVADKKKVEVLTLEEVNRLFPMEYTDVWNSRIFYTLYKLACCTGMRIGELIGLKGSCVFDNCISVEAQYSKAYGYRETKTHTDRLIPVPDKMIEELKCLKKMNGKEFVFSDDGGKEPVGYYQVSKNLRKALERIGISVEEQKRRNLTNHSFRYFLNTLLIDKNVNTAKIHAVTGHTNDDMTKRYTSIDALEYAEVLKVQENLLADKAA
jgi:integrase